MQPEETLDPEDWDDLRALGHHMVDDMLTYLQTLRERAPWQPLPDEVRQALHESLPHEGAPAGEVYDEFRRSVLPYPSGNIHPRFWGWVEGTGTPLAALAEMLAATMNPHMAGGNHAGVEVEAQVLDWCKQMLGFPAESSGLLVSGGSMANLVGLAVARTARAAFDVRAEGVGAAPRPLVLYGSEEMHSSLPRAAEVLGLGNRALRRIPVRADYRIDVAALRQAIADDLAHGLRPIAIAGCAGTVNTGAIDPLDELADVAAEHGLWFHVDGAFGALAALAPDLRPLLRGMERADSLTVDLHKWFSLPFECSCALVRDAEAHLRTFTTRPAYLGVSQRGPHGGWPWYADYGIQLTRGFRALKAWMAFKTFGVDKLGRVIRQNVAQAEYLAGLIEASPHLELVAPPSLNVVCFRFVAPGLDEARLNALNEELVFQLQESGAAVPSSTVLRGRFALRCAIVNHRSRREDFDALVEAVASIGKELSAS